MEINLKQPELFKAIRQYLESQGFNTRGKEVTINVSGGRGNNGAWAAISIEDSDIPGYEANSDDAPIVAMEGDDSQSPATADAAPAPAVIEPVIYSQAIPAEVAEEVKEAALATLAEEPSLETTDNDLFQMPTEHQPEEAKPAPATPSSLFDE